MNPFKLTFKGVFLKYELMCVFSLRTYLNGTVMQFFTHRTKFLTTNFAKVLIELSVNRITAPLFNE